VGVLFPLAAALIVTCGLRAGVVMLTTGAVYVAAGLYFRLPLPVQPLKAMAAIAIAGGASAGELAAGSLIVAAVMLLTAATGVASPLARLFGPGLVRGVQLSVGALLLRSGFKLVLGGGWGLTLPTAWPDLAAVHLGPALALPQLPPAEAFLPALLILVLPQLPVTFGNSVAATVDAARHYYGPRARRVTPRALCASIGVSNLVIGLVGGMPVCHGSGGVTAHHRLGARTALAPAVIGLSLALPALLFGDAAVAFLRLIPLPALGFLMIYVGVEHARLVSSLRGSRAALGVALVTGAVSLLFNSIAVGMAAGLALTFLARALARPRLTARLAARFASLLS
ncbi:MAG: putative sulfate/molybdate transporter, partial [Pseudomonadota bacterium]